MSSWSVAVRLPACPVERGRPERDARHRHAASPAIAVSTSTVPDVNDTRKQPTRCLVCSCSAVRGGEPPALPFDGEHLRRTVVEHDLEAGETAVVLG